MPDVSTETEIALIRQDVDHISSDIAEIKQMLVTQDQFWPVEVIVYGAVGLILTAFLEAIIALIIVTKVSP